MKYHIFVGRHLQRGQPCEEATFLVRDFQFRDDIALRIDGRHLSDDDFHDLSVDHDNDGLASARVHDNGALAFVVNSNQFP